jgi:hypothetical protein
LIQRQIVEGAFDDIDLFPEGVDLCASRAGIRAWIETQHARGHARVWIRGQYSLVEARDGSALGGSPRHIRDREEFALELCHPSAQVNPNTLTVSSRHNNAARHRPGRVSALEDEKGIDQLTEVSTVKRVVAWLGAAG